MTVAGDVRGSTKWITSRLPVQPSRGSPRAVIFRKVARASISEIFVVSRAKDRGRWGGRELLDERISRSHRSARLGFVRGREGGMREIGHAVPRVLRFREVRLKRAGDAGTPILNVRSVYTRPAFKVIRMRRLYKHYTRYRRVTRKKYARNVE